MHAKSIESKGTSGRCKSDSKIKISLADLHFFEEPCISGTNGSGAVFFTGCNMNCLFCQNYEISQIGKGRVVTKEQLAEEFLKLQERGAHNINLVTGAIYVPQIVESLQLAKANGLNIPIVYNSSGYELVQILQKLAGQVDVYLPDLKYAYDELAKDLSGVPNYFEVATKAIREMYAQVGNPKFDANGIIQKGLIIRHLVLPNHLQNTKQVLKWIRKNMSPQVFVSVMAQYFPEYKACEREDMNRKLTKEEYEEIMSFVQELGIQNGYFQELEENERQYVPEWKESM